MSIAAKAMLFIGVLGLLSAAANWLCLSSLREIDRVNMTVTQRIEPLRLNLTEAKIALAWIGLATYKMAASDDPDTRSEANTERAGQLAAARTWLNGIVEALPEHREDVDGMLQRLDGV